MSLEGLNSLIHIGGSLVISDNASLKNLEGLNNLTGIGGDLEISDNVTFNSLEALKNLTRVGGNLEIWGSTNMRIYSVALTSLNGLNNLEEI